MTSKNGARKGASVLKMAAVLLTLFFGLSFQTSRADYWAGPYYGAPYNGQSFATIDEAIDYFWAQYQIHWPSAFPGCYYTKEPQPNGQADGFFVNLPLHGRCGGNGAIRGTHYPGEPSGFFTNTASVQDVDVKECDETNPCNPANGNKSQTELDYASTAAGGLAFARYYNSGGEYKTAANLAPGWRHSYSRSIDEEPDRHPLARISVAGTSSGTYSTAADACASGWGVLKDTAWSGDLASSTAVLSGGNNCKIESGGSTVAYFPVVSVDGWSGYTPSSTVRTVIRHNGAAVRFELNGSDWVNELNPALKLEQSGGDWVFTDTNDTEETYDSGGKLVSITYRNGQSETLDYDLTLAQGGDDDALTLDRVTGPFGHTLTFAYDANGNLGTLTTPDGAILYAYDAAGNLSTVTYPDTAVREYHYEVTSLPNLLTGITDENSDRYATWAYDSFGRAISSEHAGGKEHVDLSYNTDGTTTLTMGNGAVRHYNYTTQQGSRKLSMLSGDVCSTCPGGNIANRSYDSNGFLYEAADWNGNTTRTVRNSRGLTETLIEGFGSAEARTTTTVWDANYRLPASVTSPKNSTAYTYDADGNVLTITISGGGLSRGWTFTYNADGQPLTINGPRTDVTDVTTLEYYTCTTGNECGQLKKVTNALGQVTNFDSYDSAGRLLQMTGPNGLQTSITYDSHGRVLTATQTPPVGTARVTTMTYDGVGQLLTMTLPDSSVLTYVYDAAHYLTSVTDSLGNYVSYDYDAMGQLIDEDTYDSTATLKRALDYAQDLNYRLDTITDGGYTTDLTYDLVGNLTGATDPNTNVTQHTYDALNRLDTTIDALTGVSDFDYDDHDNLTQVVAANGATTTYAYDALDNLISETSPDRGLTTYTYDDAGNRLTATDARAISATYAYDALNRLTSVSYPDTTENVVYAYDDVASNGIGRLTSISDQSGTTSYTYDAFGSVATDSRLISGVAYTTSYEYDAAGNVSSITYPSGRVVDYGRDVAGQITQVTSTKSSVVKNIVTSASYEPFGPVKALTYGNGLNFDYQHRTDYRTSEILSTGVVDKSYAYDAAGNITGVTDALDATLDQGFSYDALHRLTNETQTGVGAYWTGVLSDNPTSYLRLGEASGSIAGDATGNGNSGVYGGSVLLGEPSLISTTTDTSMRSNTAGAGYAVGPTLTGTAITGVEFWFQTDSVSDHRDLLSFQQSGNYRALIYHRISDGYVSVWRNIGGNVLNSDSGFSTNQPHYVALWYESSSNKTYMMVDGVTQQNAFSGNLLDAVDPEVVIGGYKSSGYVNSRALGELDDVAVYNTPVTAAMFSAHYASGAPGGGGPANDYVYDANGNRTSLDGSGTTTTYGYQASSNQLTSIDSAAVVLDAVGNQTVAANGTRTYSYDDSNRLDEVFDNGVVTASYIHNALGQRVKKTVGSSNTVYIYDISGSLIAEHDLTGTLIRDYVRLDGMPVAQIDQGEVVSYLHFDHLGTPRQATDDSQAIVWRWDGNAFGSTLPDEDPDGNGTGVTVNLRFAGQYYDVETGLHYNYFRTYDPSTGRYLESDPIGLGGGLNTYGYALQNPLSYTDALGLAVEECGDDEDCIQKCLDEYYGSLIDRAWDVSPFSLISLGLNEAATYAEGELGRQANRNRYTGARNSALGGRGGYSTGRRQARLLTQFRRFNAAAAIASAGAVGFLGGAYATCAVRCAFK